MRKVPLDIDQLMWSVAENPTPEAISDFESRFPDFSLELGRRIRTVHDLRGAKLATSLMSIPRFQFQESKPKTVNRWMWATGALAAAALAMGSYQLTRSLVSPPQSKTPIVNLPPLKVTQTEHDNLMNPKEVPGADLPSAPAVVKEPVPETVPASSVFSIRMRSAPLEAVLLALAKQANLHIEVAPGLSPDPIDVDFTSLTAKDMLAQLGAEHGFTAFDEGNDHVLIVPAREDTEKSDKVGPTPTDDDSG